MTGWGVDGLLAVFPGKELCVELAKLADFRDQNAMLRSAIANLKIANYAHLKNLTSLLSDGLSCTRGS